MSGHRTRTRGTKWIPRCQSLKSIRRKQNEPRNPMCPACIANMTLIAAGAGSTGGLTAVGMKRLFLEPTENIKQTKLEEGKKKIETMEGKTELREIKPSKIGSKTKGKIRIQKVNWRKPS